MPQRPGGLTFTAALFDSGPCLSIPTAKCCSYAPALLFHLAQVRKHRLHAQPGGIRGIDSAQDRLHQARIEFDAETAGKKRSAPFVVRGMPFSKSRKMDIWTFTSIIIGDRFAVSTQESPAASRTTVFQIPQIRLARLARQIPFG